MRLSRWSELERIFEAVEATAGVERGALLDQLCGEDRALRADVDALLAPPDPGRDRIAEVIAEGAADLFGGDDEPAGSTWDAPPERIGRYRIARLIGRGGMGVVFEATRIDDFHKRVALKVIRRDLDFAASRQRFERERQLLANLEHPYIARLLDGGETPGGSPYLVMEYVDGAPFLDHCVGLGRGELLRVFLKVCEAVEHAHRNLVIHRDLKPSNILVSTDGDPKLLDFGIATLIAPDISFTGTRFGAVTLAYASPEQILGRSMTTATDVYSLGVILYRILAGRAPYDLEGATPAQVERIVCVDPPAPGGLGDELDDILMMALRKEPERRYGGARQLADDIQRYLDHQPVRARPDTFGYRARKFVRRQWPALLAAGAVGLAVATGTAATLYQAHVAQDRFTQLRHLAHAFVFDYGDDLAKIEGSTAVRERMVGEALTYLGALSRDARGDARLQRELAAAYAKIGNTQGNPAGDNLGHIDQGLASYAQAARLYEQAVARDPTAAGEVGAFYVDYAKLLILAHDPAAADRASAKAFVDLDRAGRAAPNDATQAYRIAHAWCILGDAAQSPALQSAEYHRCNLISQDVLARWPTWDNQKLHLGALIRDADDMVEVGRIDDALAALKTEQTLLDEALASHPHDPEVRKRQTMLAQIVSRTYYDDMGPSVGDKGASLAAARQYLDLARRGVDLDPRNAGSRFSLAVGLFRISFPMKYNDPEGAVRSARESLAVFDAMIADGKGSPLVTSRRVRAERRLGEALLFAGHTTEAAIWIGKALADHQRQVAAAPGDFDEAANLVIALIDAGRLADIQGDPAGGLALLTQAESRAAAIVDRDKTNLPAAVLVARARQEMADHWRGLGDGARSAEWARAAARVWRDFPDPNPYVRKMALNAVALPR